jgi:NAD-dependent deacetylase
MADPEELERVAALLRAADRIVVLTCAGISTESGIPDFRGPQGLWTKDPAAEKKANIRHYVEDADHRREVWRNRAGSELFAGQPNTGHVALAELERKANLHTLVTQNVDGLHQAAGSSPEVMIEIHGTVHDVKCLSCGWRGPMEETLARVRAGEDDPHCLECGGMLKSATISFGENLVPEDLVRAQRAAEGADVFLAVGTSLGVYPAAALPEQALRAGATLVILNGEATPFDGVAHFVFRDRLGEVLPDLVERV